MAPVGTEWLTSVNLILYWNSVNIFAGSFRYFRTLHDQPKTPYKDPVFRTPVSHTFWIGIACLTQTQRYLHLLISENKCQGLASWSSKYGHCQNSLAELLHQIKITLLPLFRSAVQQNQQKCMAHISCLMIPTSYYFILTSVNNLLLQICSLSTHTFILPQGKSKFAVIIYYNHFYFFFHWEGK